MSIGSVTHLPGVTPFSAYLLYSAHWLCDSAMTFLELTVIRLLLCQKRHRMMAALWCMSDYGALGKISQHYPVHPMSHHSGCSVTEECCCRMTASLHENDNTY